MPGPALLGDVQNIITARLILPHFRGSEMFEMASCESRRLDRDALFHEVLRVVAYNTRPGIFFFLESQTELLEERLL